MYSSIYVSDTILGATDTVVNKIDKTLSSGTIQLTDGSLKIPIEIDTQEMHSKSFYIIRLEALACPLSFTPCPRKAPFPMDQGGFVTPWEATENRSRKWKSYH